MSLLDFTMQKDGQLPKIVLEVVTLESPISGVPGALAKIVSSNIIDSFLNYEFNSSILVPIDQFSFSFAMPAAFTDEGSATAFNTVVREGDIIKLSVNDDKIATGMVDTVDIEVSADRGEIITIHGRDLIGQLEDQDAVTVSLINGVLTSANPIYFENVRDVSTVINTLLKGTRIPALILQDVPAIPQVGFIFATEPMETKLAALQRFLEPLNVIFWSNEEGQLIVGKPSMNILNIIQGNFFCMKSQRDSNVLDMKATFSANQIPNVILPIYAGQQPAIQALQQNSVLNNAPGPDRLRRLGSVVQKVVTVADPKGGSVQDASEVNAIIGAGGSILQKYAEREIARQNQKELIVQVTIPGHVNESGDVYRVNTCYYIEFEQAAIREKMYCYEVHYVLDDSRGAMTRLSFCRTKTIVADGLL